MEKMRHASSSRRTRSRGNGGRKGNQNKNQIFDSNGPDVRIRGTAFQIHEKYVGLAKDSAASGDHVMAESYLQHAEHYQRVINSWEEKAAENRREQQKDNPNPAARNRRQRTPDNIVAKEEDKDLALPESIVGKKETLLEDA